MARREEQRMNTEEYLIARYVPSKVRKHRERVIRYVEFALVGLMGAGIYALTVLALAVAGVL